MRIAFITPENWMLEIAGALYSIGHDIRINQIDEGRDMAILWSVTRMPEFVEMLKQRPNIPFILYNWDTYYWQHQNPRLNEYNWMQYGELLKRAKEVWCPSEACNRAMREIYGVEGIVVKTYAPLHHLQGIEIKDEGYVLHAMRPYPDDFDSVLDEVCKELGYPLMRTKNLLSLEEYKKAIGHCSFIVSHYKEASTGGLSLVDAASLGKPCLVSDSPYNAGGEYVDAWKFRYGDKEDLRNRLQFMWEKRLELTPHFSPYTLTDMVSKIDTQLKML